MKDRNFIGALKLAAIEHKPYPTGRVRILRDRRGEYFYKVYANNGVLLAAGGGSKTRAGTKKSLDALKRALVAPEVE